jgi:hypothetical protein
MRRRLFGLILTIGALLTPVSLSGHHGAATFETSVELTLKGTVTDWAWFNPHCILRFDVKDEKDTVTNWAVEGGNPTDMTRRGWSRTSFRPGHDITVTLQQAKSGAPVGRIRTVVLADGRKMP